MIRIFRSIKNYLARERARLAKLKQLFQDGNQVRSVSSGNLYKVLWTAHCSACLEPMYKGGHTFIVDWFTPAGTVRTEVADCWELVDAD